jgi:hypothetical protein
MGDGRSLRRSAGAGQDAARKKTFLGLASGNSMAAITMMCSLMITGLIKFLSATGEWR